MVPFFRAKTIQSAEFLGNIARWKGAQRAELRYWLGQLDLLGNDKFLLGQLGRFSSEISGKHRRILEVGCGPFPAIRIMEGTLKVGVDPLADKYLVFGKRWVADIERVRALGEYLPFATSSFDLVLCRNVLDHVARPFSVLSEIKQTMKPRGLLLLMMFVLGRGNMFLKVLMDRFDRPHPHHMTFRELESLCEVDFERYEAWITGRIPRLSRPGTLIHDLLLQTVHLKLSPLPMES